MACRVLPTAEEKARSALNAEAEELLGWLNWKTGNTELDATGRLCGAINELGENNFLELIAENIKDPEARKIAGWWEDHQAYDEEYGRR